MITRIYDCKGYLNKLVHVVSVYRMTVNNISMGIEILELVNYAEWNRQKRSE